MKKTLLAIALAVLSLSANAKIETSPADMVNPLMGTLSKHSLSTGNTYPAIALPWGMNFWMPQTGRMGDGWAYVYTDDKIRDFKQTHQPSPWINDYAQFAIMPEAGKAPEFHQDKRASWFSHKSEVARPYFYKVYLADYDVTAEIAPTERAAIMRVTYPETDKASFVLDALDRGSYVKIIPEKQMIIGYTTKNVGGVPDNFKNYFVLKFDHPFAVSSTVEVKATGADRHADPYGDIKTSGSLELKANHTGAIIEFAKMKRGEQVNVRIASSFISHEQAEANLNELGSRSFDQVKNDAKDIWNKTLGVFEIDDPDRDNIRTFYSCLYRAVLFPRAFWEVQNGKPVHYSPFDGKIYDGYMYTDAGFWDVFRCLFPLLNLIYPETNEKIQAGLANIYRESGFLPEWMSPGHRPCMVGNNSASIVADAILLGLNISDADKATLWDAVVHGANAVHPTVSSTGRYGWEYYNKLGYVPYDVNINENVARTLEYAYDDWCIYKLGLKLGKSDKELLPFKAHALNYENVFDKESNLMRGRNVDGTFQSPYSPMKWGDAFTEGNAWHYTWSVFHDPMGLENLMGGQNVFNAMLDSVFNVPPVFDDSYYGGVIHEIREMQIMNMGNYAHGNQPIQHMIYLYDWSAQPWKTQYWVRETMDKLYSATPDGYCGDEDNGQTSAWYVFSSMGFYPVCPGSGEYAIGSPNFQNMKVHFRNGKTLEITAPDNNAETRYIQSVTVNGVNHDKSYLTYDQLINGGKIVYQMGNTANTQRGTSAVAAPYSFTNELGVKAKTQLRNNAVKLRKAAAKINK